MEMLDVVDINGNLTGETVERKYAHLHGIMHKTSHVWLIRKNGDSVQILLQKRSCNKASFPGCFDISSAGHIPAGSDFIPSALRELKEELGVDIKEDELIFCGNRIITDDDNFNGIPFHDREFTKVFCVWNNTEQSDFKLQKEEVDSVCWVDFYKCIEDVEKNKINHCIFPGELYMVKNIIVK